MAASKVPVFSIVFLVIGVLLILLGLLPGTSMSGAIGLLLGLAAVVIGVFFYRRKK